MEMEASAVVGLLGLGPSCAGWPDGSSGREHGLIPHGIIFSLLRSISFGAPVLGELQTLFKKD